VLPAVVSLALGPMLEGPDRPATVLGVADPAAWIGAADGVLVLSTADAVRLPNSAVVAPGARRRPFERLSAGDSVTLGDGRIAASDLVVPAVRWFDPVPALPAARPAAVARVLQALDASLEPMDDHGLAAALASDDDLAAMAAIRRLIGRGDGLTPRGDDVVAGTIAGLLLIGRSVAGDVGMVEQLRDPVLEHAATATTALSAALLRHAFRGEVAEPAGRLLTALAGRGDPFTAADRLAAVGHSSGPALAAGVVAGARAAIERSP
jgi:hypothetical protein